MHGIEEAVHRVEHAAGAKALLCRIAPLVLLQRGEHRRKHHTRRLRKVESVRVTPARGVDGAERAEARVSRIDFLGDGTPVDAPLAVLGPDADALYARPELVVAQRQDLGSELAPQCRLRFDGHGCECKDDD